MLLTSKRLMSSWFMKKETYFCGKSVSIDLAQVMGYERLNAVGIGKVLRGDGGLGSPCRTVETSL